MSPRKKQVGVDLGLTEKEKEELLEIARAVIEAKSQGKSLPPLATASEALKQPRGAFVSIHKKGMLRGCIGSLEAATPLFETVADVASSAAFRDPRFRPVSPEEIPYLDVEISVLTPYKQIANLEEIEVGLHGIIVRRGSRSGLLLPQVATERKWDRLTFLAETCRKAGLSADAWKDPDTKIYVFSADVF